MNKTLDYYNKNADNFVQGTASVDFKEIQDRFLKYIEKGACILDFGCGSGRDTKYFLEQGYKVEAIDGSEELCKKASTFTNIQVKQLLFQELDEVEKYDGIWACASILHLPKNELMEVFKKMKIALKLNGKIYTSFKYGEFEGERNGRYFTDFTKETFSMFISELKDVAIVESWVTEDVRPGRKKEQWFNVILRKI